MTTTINNEENPLLNIYMVLQERKYNFDGDIHMTANVSRELDFHVTDYDGCSYWIIIKRVTDGSYSNNTYFQTTYKRAAPARNGRGTVYKLTGVEFTHGMANTLNELDSFFL
jgi:hypothetical protein